MITALKCWHCGKISPEIEVPGPPQFAFEVAGWANDIGWHGVIDMGYGRSLVFCCKEHGEAEKTKKGLYRFRPKGNQSGQIDATQPVSADAKGELTGPPKLQ